MIALDPSQERANYSELDERADYFYEAVTTSSGMVSKTPGIGQAYLGAYKDKNDGWFDGSQDLQATLCRRIRPPSSSGRSRSMTPTIALGSTTHTQNADVSSRDDGLRRNHRRIGRSLCRSCGAQVGFERNWLQTAPGKAWFAYFRLYGPLEPYLDRSWKLSDFEVVS